MPPRAITYCKSRNFSGNFFRERSPYTTENRKLLSSPKKVIEENFDQFPHVKNLH